MLFFLSPMIWAMCHAMASPSRSGSGARYMFWAVLAAFFSNLFYKTPISLVTEVNRIHMSYPIKLSLLFQCILFSTIAKMLSTIIVKNMFIIMNYNVNVKYFTKLESYLYRIIISYCKIYFFAEQYFTARI